MYANTYGKEYNFNSLTQFCLDISKWYTPWYKFLQHLPTLSIIPLKAV